MENAHPLPASSLETPAPKARKPRRKARKPLIERYALIIGSMKSGTTSLYDYLVTHPEIARCKVKEPRFFASPRYRKGRRSYEKFWQDYDPERHAYALEASSHYTKRALHPNTAERIGSFGAQFKFLYIVRDPVDRIESHIAHSIAKGRVTLETYPRMLENALSVSRYGFQLDSFRQGVGGQEVLVLDFDELRHDPAALLERCTRFLGIDAGRSFDLRPPSNARQARNGSETFRLSPEERARLGEALREDALRFAERYDFDVSGWSLFAEGPPRRRPAPRPAPLKAPMRLASPPSEPKPELDPKPASKSGYWRKRQEMMYYRYVLWMAERLTAGARSLIDVGSHNTSIAEEFPWIPHRVALDLNTPYSSPAVRGITADFLTFEPERRFDMALCLQVLEHVPEAPRFAKKLLDVADRVLISVPYRWPEGTHPNHCQDPVNERKLARWFGRKPDYQIVVEEPFRAPGNSRRLIAYFHTPGQAFRPEVFRQMKPPKRP